MMKKVFFIQKDCRIVWRGSSFCGKHYLRKINFKILEFMGKNILVFKIVKQKVKIAKGYLKR